MGRLVRIGLVGDRSETVVAHGAIPGALALAAEPLGCQVELDWLATAELEPGEQTLGGYHGLWCIPGSPYQNMEAAIGAIRYAREQGVPFLGTCGGFQHAVIEYFRNVLGLEQADHAERNPGTALPVMSLLTCPLVEERGQIVLAPGSRSEAIYGRTAISEVYHCRFGVNPSYQHLLQGGALRVAGRDDQDEIRIVELEGHPFFIGTLFQPERSALHGERHALIGAYLAAALARSVGHISPTAHEPSNI